MVATGLSTLVRSVAKRKFVEEQRHKGVERFSIPVSSMKDVLAADGFPPNHIPQICNALRSKKFLDAEGLELERTDGPPSMTSTTVVFHYRFKSVKKESARSASVSGLSNHDPSKDPLLRLEGLLKDVFSEMGGGENFLRKLRKDDDNHGLPR